ncbi:MAG: TldD/PmbA family protein [Planctomycetes bacterium]|nr:TldD/PmbA family protein [Planctomycetota bacterium]MBM4078504.1 TldD/PmbA family protein [Planctomycetota bacterium]
MRDQLESALKKSTADYCEIRIERSAGAFISFRGEELDRVGTARSVGGIARACWKGGWGMATFNDLTDLGAKVRDACECARLVGKEKTQLAACPPVVDCTKAQMGRDFREVPLAEKKKVVEEYNRIAFNYHDKVETTNVNYSDGFLRLWYANTDGTYIEDERPDLTVSIRVTAREGDNVQQGMESVAGPQGFDIALGLRAKAEQAAQRAVDLLSAPTVKGGQYTVVLNPKLGGVFAHEAFGHLSEADFVYENPKMRELMVLGKRFGPDHLSILDDGSIPGMRGTHKYDDEGVKTRKNYLIKDGILVGRLHNRETAGKMGEPLTGNARALGYSAAPIVRMTNTYIDKGWATFDELIRDIQLGVYACDMYGGSTMMEMFTFSAGYAYMIRDGKVAEMVRDVVLTGNLFVTLMNIDALGREIEWPVTGGGCGKGAQAGLPVGFGSPHVRIQNVTVGGRQ